MLAARPARKGGSQIAAHYRVSGCAPSNYFRLSRWEQDIREGREHAIAAGPPGGIDDIMISDMWPTVSSFESYGNFLRDGSPLDGHSDDFT